MKCSEPLERLSLSVLGVLLFSLITFAKTEINLKQIVYLNSTDVYVKDIADIKSDNKNLKKYISSIKLKTLTKEKDKVTKAEVLKALKSNYIDISTIKVNGKYTIVVLNTAKIDENYVKQEIKKYLEKRYNNIKIQEIKVPKVNLEVIGKPKIRIVPKGKTNNYMYFDIFINRKKFSVSIRYYPVKKVVVASRYIPKGSTITPYDVKISKVKVKRDERYFTDINEVLGKKVKFSIKAEEPIKEKNLEKEFFVKRNTNVEVIYEKGGFRIKLLGRALQNGEIGDLIKVRNLSSGKVILCKVIGKNKVKFISGLK